MISEIKRLQKVGITFKITFQRLRGIAKTKDIINLCLNEASSSIRAALSLEVGQLFYFILPSAIFLHEMLLPNDFEFLS